MWISMISQIAIRLLHIAYKYMQGRRQGRTRQVSCLGPRKEYTGETPKIQVSCKSDFSLKKGYSKSETMVSVI